MPDEHDDDLEVSTPAAAPGSAAEIALALTVGLERIAAVLERGLAELRAARGPGARVRKARTPRASGNIRRSRAR